MVGALKALGIQLDERWEQQEATVIGCGGRFPVQDVELFLGNAGTAMRCVAAATPRRDKTDICLDWNSSKFCTLVLVLVLDLLV